MEVRFTRRVLGDIDNVERYISQQGYPETAFAYTNLILDFARALSLFPEKYSVCKYPAFMKRGFRCAPFDSYILVYRINGKVVEALRLIHGKRLNY